MSEVSVFSKEPQKTAILNIMPIHTLIPVERHLLPNRRECHTETLEMARQEFTACIGFDPETGQPRELFLDGGKEGSQVDALLSDAATAISIALQYGVPPAALVKSVGRLPGLPVTPATLDHLATGHQPASAIGAALDLLCKYDADEKAQQAPQ